MCVCLNLRVSNENSSRVLKIAMNEMKVICNLFPFLLSKLFSLWSHFMRSGKIKTKLCGGKGKEKLRAKTRKIKFFASRMVEHQMSLITTKSMQASKFNFVTEKDGV